MENMEETKVEKWKNMENMEEIPGCIVKWYGNYGKKVSRIGKR
jgi:hypothetical protein